MRIILQGLFLFLPFLCLASTQTDSIAPIVGLQDSVFISFEKYPQKTYLHKVKPGQTPYSISRFFGLSVEELKYFNPTLPDTLSVGLDIEIPIPSKAIFRYIKGDSKDYIPLYYEVQPKDNLYRLSKVILRMPIDTIRLRNDMKDANLSIGQVLMLGWMSKEGIPKESQYRKGYNYRNARNRLAFYETMAIDSIEFNQNGAAFAKQNMSHNAGLVALHNRAPINSIVAVNNPMSDKTVYVKVIGRVPVIYHDTVVVLSDSAARYLGARDSRFYVRLQYRDK
jgi:hypothetical protein